MIGLVATAGLLALAVASMGPVSARTATSNSALTADSSYVSVTPARVEPSTPLAGGASLNVQVTGGTSGVPAGALAAVLNVTAVDPSAAGFLTVWQEGTTMPVVSNLNFAAGQTVPNLVTTGLSASGMVSIYLNTGSTNVIVDVEGYYTTQTTSGLFNPLSPSRAFGSLTIGGAIGAGQTQAVTVAGAGATDEVPATASAVVLNVTAAHATLPSFLTVFPAGVSMPVASNLNFGAQAPLQAIANRVTVGVGTNGQIDVYNLTGTVNVDVDVDGYYSGTGGTGSPFVAITPIRVADTATGIGTETPIAAGSTETFALGTADIPADAAGVAMNLTAIPGNKPGYLTSYPTSDTTPPVASDVNWTASESPAVPNFTIADTNGTGLAQNVQVANSYFTTGATVDVIADDFGYFAPSTAEATYTVTGGGTVPVSTCTSGCCSFCFGTEQNSASVTNTSDNAGVVDYTASGFAAGASVNLALFPSTGANAPTQPDYFTPSTADTAGTAAGEGSSNNSDEGIYEGAYINTVNGVAATCNDYENYECDGITANSSGEITFSLDSFYPDGTVPVVWTTPASAGTDTDLYVNADGTPQTGYEVGIGSSTTWGAPAAAATIGDYYDYAVESVSPSTDSFVACYSPSADQATVETTGGECNTFTYQTGDTYYYYDGVDIGLSQAEFTSYLSAASPAYTDGPAVRGDWFDEIDYNPGTSYYYYYLDVPAAPTDVTATAITSGPYAGDTSINWTAPINPDVGGYEIYEATESPSGTYAFTDNVTADCYYETSSYTNCDITTPGAGTYEFEVAAYDGDYGYDGPNSAPTAPYTVVLPVTPAPVIDSVVITPSTGNPVTGAGSALVTYNEAVTCATGAGADFTYSNTGGVGSLKGATCAQDGADALLIGFPMATVSGTTTTQDIVADPGTGDTFTYTAPSLDTTNDAVYAGTDSAPSYEANQTVTDNGDPTPTSNSGTATAPSNPLY
jgi:hypothetical protein